MERTKKEILESIPEGGMLTLPLSEESYRAWYNRAWEINKDEGWEHYSVSKNMKFNTLSIQSNPRPT